MKRICFYSILAILSFVVFACNSSSNKHFLKDDAYRKEVHTQFLKRKELAANRSKELFTVFDKPGLTTEQREALEFLYAYMPASDLADYDGDFFLGQVDAAFKARDYFDWGKKIPDDVFRHFVLVYRVNNENLDTARVAFFDELKDRVKGMTMEQAVLEVNHWCHEKVVYRGTDERTSAPLALARTSWGRCGEESTFTTTALRAVGIPARQCYTPRWAHTDDNHAWVEAWVDGKWEYIGACEPEPELNVAWFTAPAKRAMMVHTNVFGAYNGPEEKNVQTDLYSVINLLGNYADTRKVDVKIVDAQGKPVEGATIKFEVFNYAEFYPIATAKSSKDGNASIISGKGDLFVWANKEGSYGYGVSHRDGKAITITLDKQAGAEYNETIVLVPPVEQPVKEVAPEKIAANAKRLAHEDSIRNAYMATFISEANARKLAVDNKLNPDKAWELLNKSQGNWQEISMLMTQFKDNPYLMPFLASISDKDLRDTPSAYLADHLGVSDPSIARNMPSIDIYAGSVLSPRIGVELIRPWRGFFTAAINKAAATPEGIVNLIRKNVKVDDAQNYYKCPISPQGSYQLGITDTRSRNALFVAMCRSMNIPARIEESTRRPQYFENGKWIDVFFDPQVQPKPKAAVTFTNAKGNIVKPAYTTHYTLGRYENGDFVTLNFENVKEFPAKESLDAGYYRLLVATRGSDGSVTIDVQYLNIKPDENKKLEIKLPKVDRTMQVQGIVDTNTVVTLKDGSKKSVKELSKGKGLMVFFSDPDKEPTKHILQDLPAVKQAVEEWGGGVLFVVPDDKLSKAFDASVFKGLPKQATWAIDNKRVFLKTVAGALQLNFSNNFPLAVYLSTNGGILFSSQGYRIGIGEDIVKTIKSEAELKKASCATP